MALTSSWPILLGASLVANILFAMKLLKKRTQNRPHGGVSVRSLREGFALSVIWTD